MATINISLPEGMRSFVEEETSHGGYSSASEYVRGLIREAQTAKAQRELETRLLEGMASKGSEWTPDSIKKIKRRLVDSRRQAR